MTRLFLAFACALALPACKSDGGRGAPSASAVSPPPAPAASTGSAAAASAPQPNPPGTKAKASIGGTSISDIGVDGLRAALESQGYTYEAGREIAIGSTETVVVKAKQGTQLAAVTVVRPTGLSEHDRLKLASAEAQRSTFEKKGAAHFEAGVLLGVEVEGDPAKAKLLLEALLDD